MLNGRQILLVIGGGIAAYKSLDLIRRLRERGSSVRVVMTEAATAFVTPQSAGALSGEDPFTGLFDRAREHDVGHIRLAREADLVIVAPATANLMARMAGGHASDLAATILLATERPILLAPAMNPTMWAHPATQRNRAQLGEDGVHFIGPETGEMAEAGESGLGRMAEPGAILAEAERLLGAASTGLSGRRVLVTAGPTHEPLDPVRFIANRSSGRQGYAIAAAAADAGAEVALISGPVMLPAPHGVTVTHVETAAEMEAAVQALLPADIAIMAAAVGDWRASEPRDTKLKKEGDGGTKLDLIANPDILAMVSQHPTLRPKLVVGFAAETNDLAANARAKRAAKRCDWIVANDVSPGSTTMGGDTNEVLLITADGEESWPTMPKTELARRLVGEIARHFGSPKAAE